MHLGYSGASRVCFEAQFDGTSIGKAPLEGYHFHCQKLNFELNIICP